MSDVAALATKRSPTPMLGLLWDVGLPMAVFYALRLGGASEWAALLTATLIAGARVAWVAARSRRITVFGALMAVLFGLGLALAFVTGDPRMLLAKNSLTAAVVGVAFLGSLALRRPLTLIAFQTWRPAGAEELAWAYTTDPDTRRQFRIAAWAWGIGLLLSAALRLPLVYLLPLDVAVAVAGIPGAVIMGGLGLWTVAFMRKLSPVTPRTALQRAGSAIVPVDACHRSVTTVSESECPTCQM